MLYKIFVSLTLSAIIFYSQNYILCITKKVFLKIVVFDIKKEKKIENEKEKFVEI